MRVKRIHYFAAFMLVLIWGSSWPVNKIALNYCSPQIFVTLRIIMGLITLLIIYKLKQHKLPIKKHQMSTGNVSIVLIGAMAQVSLFMIFMNIGLEHIHSGLASTLAYTTPFFVYPFSILVLKENRVFSISSIGFILGLIGISLILFDNQQYKSIGVICLTLAAISMAIGICATRLILKKYRVTLNSLETIICQLIIATFIALLWTFLAHDFKFILMTNLILCLIYCGAVATGFGFLLLNYINVQTTSSFTSFTIIGVPIVGNAFSRILLHESLSTLQLIGTILIVICSVLILLQKHKSK